MIKVFTTNEGPENNRAGNKLTEMFETWRNSLATNLEVISFHTNSNKYGWSLTVLYKFL